MQKTEAQPRQPQSHPAARPDKNGARESSQGRRISQLEAMAQGDSRSAAQRRMMGMIHNSPRMAAQRHQLDGISAGIAPHVDAAEALEPQVTQREEIPTDENNTGLPDTLKTGIESLSGVSMDSVQVHYNSSQPAQLNALASTQGTNIHIAPGQEQHLPHEAWHVVQQAQGRVKPTLQMKDGAPINDDPALEHEADTLGAQAALAGAARENVHGASADVRTPNTDITQLKITAAVPAGTRIMVAHTSAEDTGDIGTVVRESHSERDCMVVVFDSEPDEQYRVYFHEINVLSTPTSNAGPLPSDDSKLKDMLIGQVNKAISDALDGLRSVMSTDTTQTHGVEHMMPEMQLAKCLELSETATAEAAASCLYTSYFYEPLNKHLRKIPTDQLRPEVEQLVHTVHALLKRAYRSTATTKTSRWYRMELKSEWLGGKSKGSLVPFLGFTSMHPNLAGVNSMWPDIENGTFGDVTRVALLVFEGVTKTLEPDPKYFPNEREEVMESGASARVERMYQTHWPEDSDTQWVVHVYHLGVPPGTTIEPQVTINFMSSGYLEER